VLDVFENAAENYDNLAATVFNNDKPIRKNVQLLLDDEVHIFTIAVKSLAGAVTDTRSVSIQLNMQPAEDTRIVLERFYPDRVIAAGEALFEADMEVLISDERTEQRLFPFDSIPIDPCYKHQYRQTPTFRFSR
jgi:hypothetical protein